MKVTGSLASAMGAAINAFLGALQPAQRARAALSFAGDDRLDWHFVPFPRIGIALRDLDVGQRHFVDLLLAAGLGEKGATKATRIMDLEVILGEKEQKRGPVRDPDLYYVSLFGLPGSMAPWGWRFEGHHISINFTVVDGDPVSSTPAFFGANPADGRVGERPGMRILAAEEDLARSLVLSFDDSQRSEAIIGDEPPWEILSGESRRAIPLGAAGLPARRMNRPQAAMLQVLLDEHASGVAEEAAAARLAKVRAAGLDIRFAWAGGQERGDRHYYRIQGPTFLIEYANTRNNANHVHTVWREYNGDFGADLLARHFRSQRHASLASDLVEDRHVGPGSC